MSEKKTVVKITTWGVRAYGDQVALQYALNRGLRERFEAQFIWVAQPVEDDIIVTTVETTAELTDDARSDIHDLLKSKLAPYGPVRFAKGSTTTTIIQPTA